MSPSRAVLALPLVVLVGLVACAARKPEPEILGSEYQTTVSSAADPSPIPPADDAGAPLAAGSQVAEQSATPPTIEPEPTLRVVDVMRANEATGMALVAQLSREPRAIHPFELTGPRRCVADVDGPATASPEQQVIPTDSALAPRLRIGRQSGRIRLVLDVDSSGATTRCQVTRVGSAVLMVVGEEPHDAVPEAVWTASASPPGARAHATWVLARAGVGAVPSPAPSVETASAAPETARAAALASRVPDGAPASDPTPARPQRATEPDHVASAPPVPPEARLEAPHPVPSSVLTGDVASGSVSRYTGRRISLEFKDADLLNVLRIIADVAQKNIVATDDVKGRVTIVLRDVPWDQALDILLKSTGLERVEYDDVITVSTAKRLEEERRARLAAQQAGRELEPLRTEYIRINYVRAGELANILQGGASTSGAAAVAAQQIAGQSADSAGQRRGLLSSRGSVQINEATNTLIVRDIDDGLLNARELVRRLDVQTPQVAIQGLIFEADTNVDRSLGIRWGANYVASPETGNPTGVDFPGRIAVGGAGPNTAVRPDGASAPLLVDFPAPGVVPGSGSTLGLFLGSLSGVGDIDAQITALERAGKGKVVSRPKVVTLNNAEATIQSLEILRVRLPSTGTVINTGAGGTAGSQTVATQAIDTGIILRVTPQVSSDGYVLMQMFVKSSVPSQQTTDDIPNEISRQATSQVLVREGETVVIGGVYRQRANKAESGLPWLRTIPVFGWLFKNQQDTDNRQELLVFITPRVVWSVGSGTTLPNAQELWEKRGLSAYPAEPSADALGAPPATGTSAVPVGAPRG
jgi:type IV pilus secretin PilQ/predicted competence protein